jgi:RTX calcium-binding nonapeptide repeat (4 copies)
MSTLYISPTKAGSGDGSSWANAASLSDLSSMIAKAGPGGTVLLRADQGAYHTTGQISITRGGTDGNPVTIMGVDGAGNSMNAEIIGTRAEAVTPTSAAGSEVFRLLTGADNLSFEHLSFVNQGNGCFRIGANIRNLSIEHVDADNVMRFVENYVSGSATSATVDGLVVRDVEVHGFSRGVVRLGYNSHNILIEDVKGDSERQNGDSWATGIHLEGTAHDVTIRGVTMSNSFDNSTAYWNGDGFGSEGGTYNITFENTIALNNTDAGYDIKSDNVTLINATSTGNGRNFRFWGDNVTMIDSSSTDPHKQGGTTDQAHIWLGDGASVKIIGSTITDSDPATFAAFDLTKGNASLTLQETTVSLNSATQRVRYGLSSSLHHVDRDGNDLGSTITGDNSNNVLQGGGASDSLVGNGGNDRLDGGLGNDSLAGSTGNDTVTGGRGNDSIDVSSGNDLVRYTSTLDGRDVISGFDGNATNGQDKFDLDALFDSLGVAAASRAGRVSIVDSGSSVDVRINADGNGANGFELTIATLKTADAVTVGSDITVGT